MSKAQIKPRIEQIRSLMADHGLDGYYVPRADRFQNEYVPPCNERLLFSTNFSGSAGSAIIGRDSAAFFTDGRYTLQAQDEVPSDVYEIYSTSPDQQPTPSLKPVEWIDGKLPESARLGIDPWTVTPLQYDQLNSAFAGKNGEIICIAENLIDRVWAHRPAAPQSPVAIHPLDYAGEPHQQKITRIAHQLEKAGCCALVLTFPEEIAWLLNIRGNDVDFNPLPLCYAILYSTKEIDLFIDPAKLSNEVSAHFGENIRTLPFEQFEAALHDLRGNINKVWFDPQTSPYQVKSILTADHITFHDRQSPIQMAKACKNKTEINGAINAHTRDGAALTRYLYRLSRPAYVAGNTEISASNDLQALRSEQALFKDLSFDTISGAGPAGAVIHYRATSESDKPLSSGALYLCDSGGQYLDGTTDVTRTIAVDTPSNEMRANFTRVLKGHIQVAMSRFPKGTNGKPLDEKARAPLLEVGLNFAHGTGHGVGSYLCVHEGPCGISSRAETPFLPGMIVSNEPGYYKNGEYGIRIENLILVIEHDDGSYGFKTLTLAPIDRNCIDVALLNEDEKDWLNTYHSDVREKLTPLLKKQEPETVEWLNTVTQPL